MKNLILKFKYIDIYQRTVTFAVISLIINLVYAFYNGALGITAHSVWFIASFLYYLLLSFMRFFAVIYNKKEHLVMKLTGILLTVLSLVLTLIIYISISQKIVTKYDSITMITIAVFTFSKISIAVKSAVKRKISDTPVLKSIRVIRYSEIAVSVFTMQRSMIVSFGEMAAKDEYFLNIMTGTVVCIFTLIMGISLIKSKEI